MMWRLPAAAVYATLIGTGCVAEPARVGEARQSITAGAPDPTDDGVAALLRDGEVICTATLIAPTVLVTAAHCVASNQAPNAAFFGSMPFAGDEIPIVDRIADPGFDPLALTDDIAVVVLARSGRAIPWQLPVGPIEALPGAALRLVGFGATAPGDPGPVRKRTGMTQIDSATAQDFRFSPSPSQTCMATRAARASSRSMASSCWPASPPRAIRAAPVSAATRGPTRTSTSSHLM
jgi:hypothetical protein